MGHAEVHANAMLNAVDQLSALGKEMDRCAQDIRPLVWRAAVQYQSYA